MIYQDKGKEVFIKDNETNQAIINPEMLKGIREYSTLRNMIFKSADENGLVDTNLIKSLIEQVHLRSSFFALETRFKGR